MTASPYSIRGHSGLIGLVRRTTRTNGWRCSLWWKHIKPIDRGHYKYTHFAKRILVVYIQIPGGRLNAHAHTRTERGVPKRIQNTFHRRGSNVSSNRDCAMGARRLCLCFVCVCLINIVMVFCLFVIGYCACVSVLSIHL